MDNQLVKKTFTEDNQVIFECWVLMIDNKFWFKAYDVAVFLDYKRPDQAIRIHVPIEARKQLRELEPYLPHQIKTPSNWKPHTILINETGLKCLIVKTKCVNVNKIKQIVDFLELNLDVIPLNKEQSTISAIIDAFYDYRCIPQYSVLNYRIDLYLPKVKLAIECDEFNHKAHDPEDERKREREIREYLGCRFFRYNPDDKNFNMFRMIGQEPRPSRTVRIPPYWKPHTVFITEGGLNRLICRSTKPEVIRFQKWVFDEVLPTLRQQGTYTIQSLTGQVNQLSSQLAIKNEMIVTLKEKIADQHERLAINDRKRLIQDQKISRLEKRAAVIPVENETKHIFRLFRHQDIPNKYLFLRPQSKYLSRAMKVVDLDLYELIMDETNVPNAMNILNTLKEKLKLLNIKYTALANTLAIVVVNDDDDDYDDDMDNSSVSGTVNVPEMVSELIQESLT